MALPEVHAVAIEAQSAAQAAAEVLGRLSAALGTSSQLMGAWIQERDALYARQRQLEQQLEAVHHQATSEREQHALQQSCITQLEGQVQELNAALAAARSDHLVAQTVLTAEREALHQQLRQVEEQRQQLEQQVELHPQACAIASTPGRHAARTQSNRAARQGGCNLSPAFALDDGAHAHDQARQSAGRRAPAGGGPGPDTPRSDSDVSLPPSQPRNLRYVDRVPETLLVGWNDDHLFAGGKAAADAQPLAQTPARGRREAATQAGPDADAAGPGLQVADQRHNATGAAGSGGSVATEVAVADAAATDLAAAAAAAAAWAAREQELTQEHAAQLEAVWAENKALQADLQRALSYRRIAQQLRGDNQAQQQQLQDMQRQLQEARAATAAATAAAAAAPAAVRKGLTDAAASRAVAAEGALEAPGAAAAAAAAEAGATAEVDAGREGAGELSVREAQLLEERNKYLSKYREAKQACREAKQLARHWQSAYWGVLAAQQQEGREPQLQASIGGGDAGLPPPPPLGAEARHPGHPCTREALAGAQQPAEAEIAGAGMKGAAEAAGNGGAGHDEGLRAGPGESRGLPFPALRRTLPSKRGDRLVAGADMLGPGVDFGVGAEGEELQGMGRRVSGNTVVAEHLAAAFAAQAGRTHGSAREVAVAVGGPGDFGDVDVDLTQEPSDGEGGGGGGGGDRVQDGVAERPWAVSPRHGQGQRRRHTEADPRPQPAVQEQVLTQQYHQLPRHQGQDEDEDSGRPYGACGAVQQARHAIGQAQEEQPCRWAAEDAAAEHSGRETWGNRRSRGATPERDRGLLPTAAAEASRGGGGGGGGGGAGGWLNKRRNRSWDSLEGEPGGGGGRGRSKGGGGGDSDGGGADRAGGGRQAQPRPGEKLVPGRRYVQQQLPFGRQKQTPQAPQQAAEQPRRQRLQPSQSWHQGPEAVAGRPPPAGDDSDCGEAGRRYGPGAGGRASRSDTDGEMYGREHATAALPPGANGGDDSDAAGYGDGRHAWGPPPQKRKALGSATTSITTASAAARGDGVPSAGAGAAGQQAVNGDPARRPPRAPAQQPTSLPHPLPSAAAAMAGENMAALAAPAVASSAAAGTSGGGGAGGGGGNGRDEPGYKYTAVVRGRAERDTLQAVECAGCRAFYEAVATWGGEMEPCCVHTRERQRATAARPAVQPGAGAAAAGGDAAAAPPLPGAAAAGGPLAAALRQAGGRHRFKYAPPATPEGFWDIGFGDTQD